jgi:putative DNA primase/helicase
MESVVTIAPQNLTVEAPAELRELQGWLTWRLQPDPSNPNGKPLKVPYYVDGGKRHGKQGSIEDRGRMTTFAAARDAAARRGFTGVGLAMMPEFGITALDFDNCVDAQGNLPPVVRDIASQTYAEYSPSGKGIRAFVRGSYGNHKSPTEGNDYGFEVFTSTGFVTFTGNAMPYTDILGLEDTVANLDALVAPLCAARFPATQKRVSDPDDFMIGREPRVGLSATQMEELLSVLDADMPREDWVRVGMALHHECDGDDTGFELWNDWSSNGEKYPSEEGLRTQWDSFERRKGSGHRQVTMATVMKMAKEAGYQLPKTAKICHKPLRPFDNLLAEALSLGVNDTDNVERLVMEATEHGPLRAEQLHRAIKAATGTSLGALRAFSQRGRDEDLDHLSLARLTLDRLGRNNILCDENAVWLWKHEGVWKVQDDRAIKHAVQAQIDRGGGNVVASTVNGVLDVLKTEVFKTDHLFNLGQPETVNCLNGELELTDGSWSLQPHRRENYRTTQIPVGYDPAALAPRFEQFLGQVFRDDEDGGEKRQALLEMMGYSLMSHARHEKFALLIGTGSNGKSVVLKLLEGLLGSANIAGVQPSNFNNTFQRAHLDQKLANIVTELKQGEVIADAELKAITSGETATVEHKNKNPFIMRPFCTCWFGTNHMPHTRDFSDALLRRAVIFEFNRTFSESERDPNLTDKLLEELPGVLNLALQAYADALKFGFTKFASCDAAKRAWALEADQVAQFIDECGVRGPGKISIGTVFSEYGDWARNNGVGKSVNKRTLRNRLTRLGFGEARDGKGRYVTGLELRSVLGFTVCGRNDVSDANSYSGRG